MSIDTSTGVFCVALGCNNDGTHVIQHPEHGQRIVCENHVNGYPADERLEGIHVQ